MGIKRCVKRTHRSPDDLKSPNRIPSTIAGV
jgi:hypothetical protein